MLSIIKTTSRFSLSCVVNRTLKTVTVIGCGLMGSGIAQVSAQSGFNVNLVDINQNLLDDAASKIKTNLQRVAKKKHSDDSKAQEKFIQDSMKLISTSTSATSAVSQADLVVEAIIENMDKKHDLFRSIDGAAPSSCIFTSNTSSLSITEIASCTKRTDRFGGIHFFNPVPMMALVEVIATPDTSKDTVKTLFDFVLKLGKTPVSCRDTAGFIVNRLLVPYMAEAVRMLERGDATAEDIDKAMQLGAGYQMGPFTLADYVGLDTTKFILDGWHKKFPDNPLFAPISKLDRLVKENKLGLKTGEGFYNYKNKKSK